MPEMHDHEVRNTIDAICARLQADLQAQMAELEARHHEARENIRRETEVATTEVWSAKLQSARDEWHGQLHEQLTAATADADRRIAEEANRVRAELEQTSAVASQRARQEADEAIARVRQEGAEAVERARQEANAALERLRDEMNATAADAMSRTRSEMQQAADERAASLRQELEASAAHGIAQLRAEADQTLASERGQFGQERDRLHQERDQLQQHRDQVQQERDRVAQEHDRLRQEHDQLQQERATLEQERDAVRAERDRLQQEIEAERVRAQGELTRERDRISAELETERLKGRALTAAVEDAQAALAREREEARTAAEAQQQVRNDTAVTEARLAERQEQLAIVERLSAAVRSISSARSLSDTLAALATAAAAVAPRAAIFIVNGRELQGWRFEGFGDPPPANLRLTGDEGKLLLTAATTHAAVSTAEAPAPAFATLPPNQAALTVPITVGGQSVAVLYADDGGGAEVETPASWPEVTQILAAHASACLAYLTALRTTQAMRATPRGAAPKGAAQAKPSAANPVSDEDSSARRYARLLVSEIKLYNEAAVRTGREKRDLLERLRPEIERARRLYEERVSTSVGARGAYFQQELIQTLADGDAALLGGTV
jgi:hypothetical protein